MHDIANERKKNADLTPAKKYITDQLDMKS